MKTQPNPGAGDAQTWHIAVGEHVGNLFHPEALGVQVHVTETYVEVDVLEVDKDRRRIVLTADNADQMAATLQYLEGATANWRREIFDVDPHARAAWGQIFERLVGDAEGCHRLAHALRDAAHMIHTAGDAVRTPRVANTARLAELTQARIARSRRP